MSRLNRIVCGVFLFGINMVFLSRVEAEVSDFSCGPLRNSYGPYDYRFDTEKLAIVELNHFTPEVANLVRGTSSERPGGDISYTLRAFPNHPAALMSMVRLGDKEKTAKPSGSPYTVECWLYRAIRFRENDGTVKMIYATYLAKKGSNAEALKQLHEAVQLGEDSANLQYNIGLVYFNLGRFDKALTHAHRAYQAGFPLPGLRDKLKKAGKWREPSASAVSDGESPQN